MDQPFAPQSRAMRISAAQSCLTVFTFNSPAALRAFLRHRIRLRIFRPFAQHDMQNLRNDLTGFIDDNRIADPDILRFNKIFIVQRGPAYRTARQPYRRQHCRRRQHACAPNLDHDILQPGFSLLRRKFKSDRPAWVLACRT